MKGLLIPVAGPINDVQIEGDMLDGLQSLVGGMIQSIPFRSAIGDRSDVAPYFNEEGKILNLMPNPRATALLAPGMFPNDYIAGDLVLVGFDDETGEERDIPESFVAELRAAFATGTLRIGVDIPRMKIR